MASRHSGLIVLVLLLVCLFCSASGAQTFRSAGESGDTSAVNKMRLHGLLIGGGVVYAGSMYGLYNLWYKNFPQTSFHFINDNSEWLQMDKFGHATTSYYLGMTGYHSLLWAGVENQKAIWYGGSLGFIYLTIIESLDGFSAEWGASPGDLMANTLGSALFISQQLGWNEQRLQLKWSFHLTAYAQYNHEQLGHRFAERALKDYNGQTYWLSCNLKSFARRSSGIPAWLNLAVGYGAEGMTAGASNLMADSQGTPLPPFMRYRQFYLAPDIDLTRIKTKSGALRTLFGMLSVVRFPLPALEFSKKGIKFHPVYF